MTAADKPRQPPLTEYVWLIVLSTLWGSSFTFLKIAVTTVPPLTAIAFRTAIAGAVLYAFMRWKGWVLPTDRESWKSFAIIAAVNTVLPFILIAWGLQYINASLAVILNSTTPIFAFLITWAVTRQEPVTQRRAFGVVAGLVGIVLIVGTTALLGLGQQLIPQLALVLSSVSYATAAIYGRAFRGMNPIAPACGSMLIGTLVLTPLAIVIDQPWTASPSWQSVGALVFLAIFCTAFGNTLYFRLLGTLGSLGTTAQSYLRVPIGVAVGVVLLGEQLTPTAGIGLVCVVAGVMAMTWPTHLPLPIWPPRWFMPARGDSPSESRPPRWFMLARGDSPSESRPPRAWTERLPAHSFEYALLLLVAALWGASYIWVKIGLGSIPPLTLMAGRIMIAGAVLLAILRWRGIDLPTDPARWRLYAQQGALSMTLPFALVAWGQQFIDAGPAAILNSISPVFAFLITWTITRHEPATPLKLFGVAAGLAGVVVVIGPQSLLGLGTSTMAHAAIVLSSLCYALGAINSHQLRQGDPMLNAACTMVAASLIILPFALVLEQPWTISPSREGILAMLTLGLVSTALGYILWFRLVRTLGSIGVTSQSYLRAPIGVVLAALMLGEPVTLAMLAGMVLVVVGVAAMTITPGAKPPSGAGAGNRSGPTSDK